MAALRTSLPRSSVQGAVAFGTVKLTVSDVARYPRPGTAIPGRIAYSPDGRAVTFLFSQAGTLARDLWRLDLASGRRERYFTAPGAGVTDENVSREEALRRERQRLRETGVTHYVWADQADAMLVPLGGELYRLDAGRAARVGGAVVDPKLSRDGRRAFFVRDGELWCLDADGERRLTSGAEPGVTNGLAEFVAQEEMARHTGYWPSPDGEWVAYERADERHVPVYPIVHQGKDAVEVEEHRYPFAGSANASVRLGVVSATGGETRWLDLGPETDVYLARVHWHPDGRLFVQLLSRDQRRLELWAYDVGSGERELLLAEATEPWINLHDDLRFVEATGQFVWSSERSGFRHLYLYDADGRLIRQLTSGDWPVDAVVGLDRARRCVYFMAGCESPLERHLHRVSLDGGALARLTREPGWHDAAVAPDGSSFVDTHESLRQPPRVTVRRPDGELWHELHAPAPVELELAPPELRSFRNRDGVELHAALYHPPAATPRPAPLIVSVYGGPHAQMVRESWQLTVDLRAQYLAAQGYLVLKVDNRGSARRGLAFEAPIAGDMGEVEVRDQVDGVEWACRLGQADGDRVGIYGWSYGGYMTAMALVKAPETFRVGVAGAPVTSWDGYDTCYTERYMRTPRANPDGYARASVLTHAGRLAGRLLLVHGMLDENVHFRHTARLVNALIEANRPHDLLIYPDERHMPRSEKDRVAMETRIVEYFGRNL
jgi:dipeptidyl-peptidase-4